MDGIGWTIGGQYHFRHLVEYGHLIKHGAGRGTHIPKVSLVPPGFLNSVKKGLKDLNC